MLQLLEQTRRPDCDLDALDRLINRDVSLSYKLLRYINSAYFRRPVEISSIRHAMSLLGERELNQFIVLVATAELAHDKPQELVRSAIIRARFCELLGRQYDCGISPSELFLLGLFSQIDAMLDMEMETVMGRLPLPERIKEALVSGTGSLAAQIGLVRAYETGNWPACDRFCQALGCDLGALPGFYLEAVGWADAYGGSVRSGEDILRPVRMRPLDHFDPGLGPNLSDQGLLVGAVVDDAGGHVNLGDLLSHGLVPQIDLGQAGHDTGARTVAAVEQAHDLGLLVLVGAEFSLPTVETHQAPGNRRCKRCP